MLAFDCIGKGDELVWDLNSIWPCKICDVFTPAPNFSRVQKFANKSIVFGFVNLAMIHITVLQT